MIHFYTSLKANLLGLKNNFTYYLICCVTQIFINYFITSNQINNSIQIVNLKIYFINRIKLLL